jgi:hypothetical protein
VLAVIARLREIATLLAAKPDGHPEDRAQLQLEAERQVQRADQLLGRLSEELPDARARNDEGRQKFDQSFRPEQRPRKRGLLDRLLGD